MYRYSFFAPSLPQWHKNTYIEGMCTQLIQQVLLGLDELLKLLEYSQSLLVLLQGSSWELKPAFTYGSLSFLLWHLTDLLNLSLVGGAVKARNNVRISFSQRVLSMTRTGTQDLSILYQEL